ncbi:TetR/AcrR family transcriptional regulator [Mangrovimonas sp. YM274]|uniref:TetR/AcrR family transcriptional regulator n=1 Tax=Mangrovimonas sp. YM274 TaxID=3070660 RepID=UPI0027DDE16E|nr:TetR/AcrR family transcriptional regulator [Mangrovimonas sp. YM274]WMI68718.1 TetR/AcrR family transcriptional regulator [Mangrovimonas sp. YM274]
MSLKSDILQCSITNFTKFGSKRFTLDELAEVMGISKKTIYKYFKNKEELVTESLAVLVKEYKEEINEVIQDNIEDPILSIILIYERGFEYLRYFKPSFLFGIKKYYPKADKVFNDFSEVFVFDIVYQLLEKAKEKGNIKPGVNLKLVCELYFLRIDAIAFRNNNLFEVYNKREILNHLIVYNLRGFTEANYSNAYFD